MDTLTFQKQLAYGKAGESRIANWLKRKGWSILPVYEIEIDSGKGPRVFEAIREIIAPDLLGYIQTRDEDGLICETRWIEAKHKSAFTWHQITGRWVTGINYRHYCDYCKLDDDSPYTTWLLFLQEGGQAKNSPPNSPSGLYGEKLSFLRQKENVNHTWPLFSPNMIYWAIEKLKKLAELEDL